LASFLDLDGFALAGFRAVAGLMPSGLPAAAGAAVASGSGLKNARHPGVNWDLFLIMQAVTRSTSAISAPQSRNASGLQACFLLGSGRLGLRSAASKPRAPLQASN
jgi:hypothetical protein